MEPGEPKSEKDSLPEKVYNIVETKADAEALIKEFWESVSHDGLTTDGIDDWTQELTSNAIRTGVRIVKRGEHKGKFEVIFQGNNQQINEEMASWLKSKSIL